MGKQNCPFSAHDDDSVPRIAQIRALSFQLLGRFVIFIESIHRIYSKYPVKKFLEKELKKCTSDQKVPIGNSRRHGSPGRERSLIREVLSVMDSFCAHCFRTSGSGNEHLANLHLSHTNLSDI